MGNTINRNVQTSSSSSQKTEQNGAGQVQQPELTKLSNFRKISSWSLGSLSSRLNWSFRSSKLSNSFSKHRTKSLSKGSNSSVNYSKTTWPAPLTDSIFISHFKRVNKTNDYIVDHVIAEGAFGIVFKVIDKKKSNLEYALKILKKSKIIEGNSVQQIKDEVDIQKLCGHHPFIVKHFDSWQTRRHLHILLEYIPGGELFTKIRNFPYELIRLYVAEISLAIDFLHNAGVIYRDVKPENILLNRDYHIKLTDFGLSKWLKFGDRTRTICGTFQYMAPEILKGEPYGYAVDWWSIGVLACRMLTDQYPNTRVLLKEFITESNETIEAMEKIVGTDESPMENEEFLPEAINTIPNEAKDLLRRLLEPDSKFRLKSILGLQKIAMYKNFSFNVNVLKEISPLEILKKENIPIYDIEYDQDHNFKEF